MGNSVKVEVVSDVMCPWCFVGKRRLEKALKLVDPSIKVVVEWKPYQLDATLPPEGKDRKQYLSEKFGGEAKAESFYETIKQAGLGEDIAFDFNAITVSPNTLDAHRVIAWAGEMGHHRQDRVVEKLFEAFFVEGKNIGDHAVLTQAAADAGMDPHKVAERLKSAERLEETRNEVDHAHKIGVTGVPCFIINDKYGISGAQDPKTLADAIAKISLEAA